MEKEKSKKSPKPEKENKEKRGSAFDCPTEGVIVPDDVVLKKGPDGKYAYYTPDGKKWKY